jgi:hypothetical protein
MIHFEIDLASNSVTYNEVGIVKPLLSIKTQTPAASKIIYEFFNKSGKKVYDVICSPDDPKFHSIMVQEFKSWYGRIWNDKMHIVELFDY